MVLPLALVATLLGSHPADPLHVIVQEVTPDRWIATVSDPARGSGRSGVSVPLPEGCDVESPGEPGEAEGHSAHAGGGWWHCQGGLTGLRVTGLDARRIALVRRVDQRGGEQSRVASATSPSVQFEMSPTSATPGGLLSYGRLGVEHILGGVDHLLFLIGLLVLVPAPRRLVTTITAFTLGHSVTLGAQALGAIKLDPAPVEALIALSLVFVAAEALRRAPEGATRFSPEVAAGTFGLLHGVGFAGALAEIGLPEHSVVTALLGFNLGVELGQLLFVIAALLLALGLRWSWPKALPTARLASGYVVGCAGAAWFWERTLLVFGVAFLCACGADDVSPEPPAQDASEDTSDVAAVDVADAAAPDTSGPDIVMPPGTCADYSPLRNLYFGDLHIHTGLSFDAWTYEVRTGPSDALAFAKGGAMKLPPLDRNGDGTRDVRLDRPLDFAAVTDHAELMAEVVSCTTPGNAAYSSTLCVAYREQGQLGLAKLAGVTFDPDPERYAEICGAVDCAAVVGDLWQRTQQAAAAADDATDACTFTAFVAYEYTAAPGGSNLHRNVIFRGDTVPALPITFFEAPTPDELWRALEQQCLDAGTGCDVLAIPHNSNWSNGNLFKVEAGPEGVVTGPGTADQVADATRRARLEPLVEIFQHKGDGECMNGFPGIANDELCSFEKIHAPGFQDCGEETGAGGAAGLGCLSKRDFVRNALAEGLRQETRFGVNPFEVGIIASTDTHAALAGNTGEQGYPGHLGLRDADAAGRLAKPGATPGSFVEGPGGLAAVWATENSREALFDALRRRETYGTSGPRMQVRFFGGALPEGLCADPQLLQKAYTTGVPMGGELTATAAGPRFLIQAIADPTSHPFARVQVIKGTLDASGEPVTRVVDVKVADDIVAPNAEACVLGKAPPPASGGFSEFCGEWTDPDFDPAVPALYYARVVERPSCRWSTWECNALPAEGRPAGCTDPRVEKLVAERAWTSPIWVAPE
ncbi:MAG: DUF3604 domain-containing protein [Myxococcales bacterium]|nr:DUF3604 domain-containing protein [Myxococcales bacterium]